MFSSAPLSAVPFSTAGGANYFSSTAAIATGASATATSASFAAIVSTAGWGTNGWGLDGWGLSNTSPKCSDTVVGKSPINTFTENTVSGAELVYASPSFIAYANESAMADAAAQAVLVTFCSTAASSAVMDLASAAVTFVTDFNATTGISDANQAGTTAAAQLQENVQAFDATESSFVYITFVSDDVQITELLGDQLILAASTSAAAIISDVGSATVNFLGHISEQATGLDAANVSVIFVAAFSDGVQITDEAILRALWELINDSQSVNWQNIASAGGAAWGTIATAQSNDWQIIQTPTTSWGTINTSQPSVWVVIPTVKGDE